MFTDAFKQYRVSVWDLGYVWIFVHFSQLQQEIQDTSSNEGFCFNMAQVAKLQHHSIFGVRQDGDLSVLKAKTDAGPFGLEVVL